MTGTSDHPVGKKLTIREGMLLVWGLAMGLGVASWLWKFYVPSGFAPPLSPFLFLYVDMSSAIVLGVSAAIVIILAIRSGFRRDRALIAPGSSAAIVVVLTAFLLSTIGAVVDSAGRIRELPVRRAQDVAEQVLAWTLEPNAYCAAVGGVWAVLWFSRSWARPRGLVEGLGVALGAAWFLLAGVETFRLGWAF